MTQTLQGLPLLRSLERRAWVLKTIQGEFYSYVLSEGISYVDDIGYATKYETRETAAKEAHDTSVEFRYTYPVEVGLHTKPDSYEVVYRQDELFLRYKDHHGSGTPSQPWKLDSSMELVRRVPCTKEWIEL